MADFGYDVSDYCDVDPLFGDLDDFDRLLADAHARGHARASSTGCPNHTSDQHPWFVDVAVEPRRPEAGLVRLARRRARRRAAQQLGRRPFARRRRPGPSTRPPASGTCTSSCPSSPTSTGRTPRSRRPCTTSCASGSTAASTASASTWSTAIGKDPALPDDPPEVAGIPHSVLQRRPAHPRAAARASARLLDGYPGDRMSVGEVFLLDTAEVAHVLRRRRRAAPGLQLPAAAHAVGRGAPWRDRIDARRAPASRRGALADVGAVQPRRAPPPHPLAAPRPRARAGRRAAAHACGARRSSTPARSSACRTPTCRPTRVVDPGGRDGCRAPIPWDATRGHGWGDGRAVAARSRPSAETRNVEAPARRPGVDPAPVPRACSRRGAASPGAAGSATLELLDARRRRAGVAERAAGDDGVHRAGQLHRATPGA